MYKLFSNIRESLRHPALRMVFFQRLWQSISGVITIFFLVHYLSLELQGWYYSFLSLAAFFTLFDLGLSVVLVQMAAHFSIKYAYSKLDINTSNSSLFNELIRNSAKIYLILSVSFSFIMIPMGLIFFNGRSLEAPEIEWIGPWIALVLSTSLNILILPFFSILEGTGLIREVFSIRFLQNFLGSMLCWFLLMLGAGLWSASVLRLIPAIVGLAWLSNHYGAFIRECFKEATNNLQWKKDIWPLQWRVGLSWISGYLLTQIYTPILFYMHGAKVAGQMGLTLAIVSTLGLITQSWLTQKIPLMSHAAGKKDWDIFDQIFKHHFSLSIALYLLGALCLTGIYFIASEFYGFTRIINLWNFLALLVIEFINQLIASWAIQLRSYKKEPLAGLAFISTIMTLPLAFWGAYYFKVSGVVAAILFIQIIVSLPISYILWKKYNREWRVIS